MSDLRDMKISIKIQSELSKVKELDGQLKKLKQSALSAGKEVSRSTSGLSSGFAGVGSSFKSSGILDFFKVAKTQLGGLSTIMRSGGGLAGVSTIFRTIGTAASSAAVPIMALVGTGKILYSALTLPLELAKKALLPMAGLMAGVAAGIFKLVSLASDTQEEMGKFRMVVREAPEETLKWADDFAEKVGRSRYETRAMITDMMALAQSLGGTEPEAFQLSSTLQKLAIDVAAAQNVADKDVFDRFQSTLMGNHEAVRTFGLAITESTIKAQLFAMGIQEDFQSLSAFEQVQVRALVLLKQSSLMFGLAEKEADNYASQVKRLRGYVVDFMREQGEKFLGTFTDVITKLNEARFTVFALADKGINFLARWVNALGYTFLDTIDNFEKMIAELSRAENWQKMDASDKIFAILDNIVKGMHRWVDQHSDTIREIGMKIGKFLIEGFLVVAREMSKVVWSIMFPQPTRDFKGYYKLPEEYRAPAINVPTGEMSPIAPSERGGTGEALFESPMFFQPRQHGGTARKGLGLVGENGAELIDFSGGERVYSSSETNNIMQGRSINFSPVINVTATYNGNVDDKTHESLATTIDDAIENKFRKLMVSFGYI